MASGLFAEMILLLHVDRETSDFVLQREGQAGRERFPSLRTAIHHAENLAGSAGAKLLVHNEDGKRIMELDL